MEKISNLESIDIKKVHVGYINENIDLWDELFDNSSVQYFFGNYNWMRSFWDACDSTHDSIIILAIEQNTNRWLGLLPITKYKTGLKDLFTTIVSQTADEYLDYFLPIVRKQFEEIVIPLLIQHFISADIKSHLLRIVNVPDENFIFPIIINTIEKYKIKYHLEPSGCPQLIFHGKSAGSLFNSFKKNHRTDIRRQIRRLEKIGKLSLVVFEDDTDVEKNWEIFLDMYKERWEKTGYVDQLNIKRNKVFLKNVVDNFKGSNLHFSGLFVDGKPISYHLGFLFNNWLYYYKPAYEIKYANFSPGKVHIWMLIEKGCKERWVGFDFLSGFEEYKMSWANQINRTSTITIHRKKWIRYNWQIKWRKIFSVRFGWIIRKISLLSLNFLSRDK